MSILLAVTLAAASTVQPTCSWDRPGANPYTGKTDAAIDRYVDIPQAVRSTLKRRVAEGLSDDNVTITRDGITGKYQYDPAIHDMHFGAASVCGTVTRGKWAESRQEPGTVYCVEQHCILVPRICGNISRIDRLPAAATAKADGNRPRRGNGAGKDGGNGADRDGPDSAERNIGDKFDNHDLGMSDAEHPDVDPEQAARDAAERKARLNGRLTFDEMMRMTEQEAREAIAGHSGVEEFTLDENYMIDEDGRLLGMHGYRSPFSIDDHGDADLMPPQTPAAPVPEPGTWAMLTAGLGLLGFAARRARRKQDPTQGPAA